MKPVANNDYTNLTHAATKSLMNIYSQKQKVDKHQSRSFDNYSKKPSSKLYNKDKIYNMLNQRKQVDKDRLEKVDTSLHDTLDAGFSQEIYPNEMIQKTVSYQNNMSIEYEAPKHEVIA